MPECEPAPPPETEAWWTESRPAGTWAWIRCCFLKGRRFFGGLVGPARYRCHTIPSLFRLTCAFPYDGIKFGAKKSLSVVEYELHHHRLDAHLHERCRAAKTCRLNLSGPGTQSGHKTILLENGLVHCDRNTKLT